MSYIAVIGGVWLILAPFLLGFEAAATWNGVVAGAAVAVLAPWTALGRTRHVLVLAIGLYVVVAAFSFGDAALFSTLVAGVIVTAAALAAAVQKPRPDTPPSTGPSEP